MNAHDRQFAARALAHSPVLGLLPPDLWDRLLHSAQTIRCSGPTLLCGAEERPALLYLVRQGQIELTAQSADGEEMTISALGPGSWISWLGLFDSRPEDDVAFAIGTTHVNDRVADEEGIEGSEYAAEIYYTWRPTPALQFRPNLQYVYRPGGDSANGNVLVLGLKTGATF